MRIACLGGGPAGLYLGISLKLRDPSHEVLVVERNRPDDTFGWGVVLSDETLDNLAENDPVSAASIREHFAYWDDVAVLHQGEKIVSSGHGFCGIGRQRLLLILQERARELGVELQFEREVASTDEFADYDVVVGADGLRSRVRAEHEAVFRPDIEQRRCRFTWLGTHQKFDDAFTFIFTETPAGWIWAHAYQFDEDTATFIVECSEETYQALGFEDLDKDESAARCGEIFAEWLGGHPLMTNARHLRGSAWLRFPKVLCENWSAGKVVLLGDAAATAHFSIGSGTKLAVESAIDLAETLSQPGASADLAKAFEGYEERRRLEVLRLQSAARNSLEWFEQIERYLPFDPVQFNYSLLTRSQRISHENLRLRDEAFVRDAEAWFQKRAGLDEEPPRPPMFTPFQVGALRLDNRIVVSPMAQYKASDGLPSDWHLVHYGERAKGGAGLVFTEMTCPSPDARITPGCTGLWSEEQALAWRRIVRFMHRESSTKVAMQLGHAGPKGSTRVGWEGMDQPLAHGNWELLGPSPIAWSEGNATPRAMERADFQRVTDDFVRATELAAKAEFDWLELHCAHGYLLSAFLTPLTNQRTDEYGGSEEARLRFPLEVFRAMRAVWPEDKPMSVRLSATDWMGEAGVTPDVAVRMARAFREAGVDLIDVSAGQTFQAAKPVYGRMFQTPFSDRIRNEVGVPTLAVGNVYEPDHVNSILMAGRADLVALARPHLADPYWSLHAAAALGVQGPAWPLPYHAGRDQIERLAERGEGLFGGSS